MARSYLHLTDFEFWDMAPKCLFAMIAEWLDIEDGKAIIHAMANNGQELPRRVAQHKAEKEPEPMYVHIDCF